MLIVVSEVLDEHLLKVTATEDEEPVQTLSADGAHESLGERVRTGSSNRGPYDADALGGEYLVEAGGELRVSIPDEEFGRSVPSTSTKDRLRACWVTHSPTGLAVTPER